MAPFHGPPARVLSPLFFLAKSLLLPKPCGKKKHSKTTWSSPIHSIRTVWPPIYLPQNHMALFLSPQNLVVLSLWLPHLGFKSQHPSSFRAPFLIPPTVSYTCQHPRILPALLGCHCKSRQVWPHGMEPIISKLSRRHCNKGELFPVPSWVELAPIPLTQSMATAI